jgi:apurinic endonuclease APN1
MGVIGLALRDGGCGGEADWGTADWSASGDDGWMLDGGEPGSGGGGKYLSDLQLEPAAVEGVGGEGGGCGEDAGSAGGGGCGADLDSCELPDQPVQPDGECAGDSVAAFRGEVERALALGAEYLLLHPGSWKGLTREKGLQLAAQSVQRAIEGLPWRDQEFRILIENTAGAEFSLGGSLEQVAELVERLRACAPMGVCLDTCHMHVKGYDIVSAEGYAETMRLVEGTVGFVAVKVWHCNDAKATCGSKLDRHEHIGEGTIGAAAFRRLLHDQRFCGAVFIAETPVDAPGDEARNVGVLRTLAAG